MSCFESNKLKTGIAPILAALLYICSCAVNPDRNGNHHLLISFQYGPEPLLGYVNSVDLKIINDQKTTVFDTAYSVNPSSGNISGFDIQIREDNDLILLAWFFDDPRRPLYRGHRTATPVENSPSIIILEMEQSGYRAGSRVRILRDEPPWDSFGLDSALVDMGLTEGAAGNQFDIRPSFDLPSIVLNPGSDLLIISNDQPQVFYDNLSIYIDKVLDFARTGGTVLWETCDLAWNYGSYADAGLDTLPGRITFETAYDPINIIADPDLGLVEGMEDTLSGFYASNKYLSNVPDSAIIYMKNSGGYPTLIGVRIGDGLIFYSGQPLEYNFDRRGEYNIGFLLPRILHFLLGK